MPRVIVTDPEDTSDFDIVCRAFKNPDPKYWEDENRNHGDQIHASVFIKIKGRKELRRGGARFPQGAAHFIMDNISEFKQENVSIAIVNELPEELFEMQNCKARFDGTMFALLLSED